MKFYSVAGGRGAWGRTIAQSPSSTYRSHKETAGGRPEGAATQLQTLGCNGHRVQSPGPRGMGWPSGFAGPANALRAKEAGDGF